MTTMNTTNNTPIHDIEMERGLLGACILSSNEADIVTLKDVLEDGKYFYVPAHKKIWASILSLIESGQPVDLLLVVNKLRSLGQLDSVGGAVYVSQLTQRVNQSINAISYADSIKKMNGKRELLKLSDQLQKRALDWSSSPEDDVSDFAKNLGEINLGINRNTSQTLWEAGFSFMNELEKQREAGIEFSGVPTGIDVLDKYLQGFRNGDLVVIPARPGMGKTALALNIAMSCNRPVGIFTLEMSNKGLAKRCLSSVAGVDGWKIRSPKHLTDEDMKALWRGIPILQERHIYLDGDAVVTVEQIRAKAALMKAQHGIEMIIIDYLQLIEESSKGKSSREREVARMSRSLKLLAKELDIPVVILAQLSRKSEERGGDHRAKLSDIRESGAIEQDADLVISPYRPLYYGIEEDEEGNPLSYKEGDKVLFSVMYADILKFRDGEPGSVRMFFDARHQKIFSYENEYWENNKDFHPIF